MKRPCPLCTSTDTRHYDYKPPRKHPPGQIACTPECTKTGLFCRRCRTLTPLSTTLRK